MGINFANDSIKLPAMIMTAHCTAFICILFLIFVVYILLTYSFNCKVLWNILFHLSTIGIILLLFILKETVY